VFRLVSQAEDVIILAGGLGVVGEQQKPGGLA